MLIDGHCGEVITARYKIVQEDYCLSDGLSGTMVWSGGIISMWVTTGSARRLFTVTDATRCMLVVV